MPKKIYADADNYERKLRRVMERFGVNDDYNFNYDRFGGWVEFRYKGQLYKFEHSVKKAKESGQKVQVGSDCFAMIVLALEDLARIVERGIYDLSSWIAGMQYLPSPVEMPESFRILGFEKMPTSTKDVDVKYRKLAQLYHPDKEGGDADEFEKIKIAAEQSKKHLEASG
jgi:hypothetical protein